MDWSRDMREPVYVPRVERLLLAMLLMELKDLESIYLIHDMQAIFDPLRVLLSVATVYQKAKFSVSVPLSFIFLLP